VRRIGMSEGRRKLLGIRPLRNRKHKTVDEIDPGVRYALEHGRLPDRSEPQFRESNWLDILTAAFVHRSRPQWARHRAAILKAWIEERPGMRPDGWWRHGAPRWQRADQPPHVRAMEFLDTCEPRRRLGGTGTPSYELYSEVPAFRFGIPTSWGDSIDPADLPVSESEAVYLRRHGLLEASERRRLKKSDFARETVVNEKFLGPGT
jgi:hypothetical protein